MKSAQRGMTLVELMTVMVIVAILASIAVPSYRSYLVRSNRADAKSALMQVQAAEEKFYLQNNAYTNNVAGVPPAGLGLSSTTTNGFYTVTVTPGTGNQSYTATAAPTTAGGQSSDSKCGSFTVTDIGKRGITGTDTVTNCWK